MKKLALIVSVVLLLALTGICGCTGSDGSSAVNSTGTADEITVYCGAGLKDPMQEIASEFTTKTGINVNYIFGGSGTLLSQMNLTQIGDAYMPGSTTDFNKAKNQGFIASEDLVVYHVPVIATPKGNPAGITSLADLGNEGVKVELGDPSACAIGGLSDKIIAKNNLTDAIAPNVVARAATVNELVLHTELGNVDASIIWADLADPEKMDIIDIPNDQNIIKIVPIGALTFSENPDEAAQFVDFVTSDEGKQVFIDHGFTTYPSDKYSDI